MSQHARQLQTNPPTWQLPAEEPQEVLNADEAAEFLRIGRNQLYEAVGRGEIPCQRIGRTLRFSRTALIKWLGKGT